MKVRVVLDLSVADGGAHPAELLESICARARNGRGVRVMGAWVKELTDDTFDHPEAG